MAPKLKQLVQFSMDAVRDAAKEKLSSKCSTNTASQVELQSSTTWQPWQEPQTWYRENPSRGLPGVPVEVRGAFQRPKTRQAGPNDEHVYVT